MKKVSLVFIALFSGLFVFQNVHSEEPSTVRYLDPSIRRHVLWRIYTQAPDSNGKMYVTVDSVLKVDSTLKDFHTKEKFFLYSEKKENANKLEPNAYYLILTIAANSGKREEKYWLVPTNGIFSDTPENREFLSQKWSEMNIIYKPTGRGGIGDVH